MEPIFYAACAACALVGLVMAVLDKYTEPAEAY